MIELYTAPTRAGVSVDGMPHLERWIAAIAERPALLKGVDVPGQLDPEVQRVWIEKFQKGEA